MSNFLPQLGWASKVFATHPRSAKAIAATLLTFQMSSPRARFYLACHVLFCLYLEYPYLFWDILSICSSPLLLILSCTWPASLVYVTYLAPPGTRVCNLHRGSKACAVADLASPLTPRSHHSLLIPHMFATIQLPLSLPPHRPKSQRSFKDNFLESIISDPGVSESLFLSSPISNAPGKAPLELLPSWGHLIYLGVHVLGRIYSVSSQSKLPE